MGVGVRQDEQVEPLPKDEVEVEVVVADETLKDFQEAGNTVGQGAYILDTEQREESCTGQNKNTGSTVEVVVAQEDHGTR